jgi:DNA mismatch repair protein MutH
MDRPTLEQVKARLMETVVGQTANIPRTTDKGLVGKWLENQTGIPTSGACLDCSDGELKLFPIKPKTARSRASTAFVAAETIAITMVDLDKLPTEPFEESRVFKKLENILYMPHHRYDESNIRFCTPIHMTSAHPAMAQIKADYEAIQSAVHRGEPLSSSLGTYLQTRTKGPGHGSTSRAFYLRTTFVNEFLVSHIA